MVEVSIPVVLDSTEEGATGLEVETEVVVAEGSPPVVLVSTEEDISGLEVGTEVGDSITVVLGSKEEEISGLEIGMEVNSVDAVTEASVVDGLEDCSEVEVTIGLEGSLVDVKNCPVVGVKLGVGRTELGVSMTDDSKVDDG